MSEKTLAGHTAFITGAARNIGKATALMLAEAGANVIVNTLKDETAATEVAEEIRARGGNAIVAVGDIVSADNVAQMGVAGREAFGDIDILVANASARGQIDFLEMDHATFRRVVDISIDATFHLAQAMLPMMVEKGWGRIVTVGGISWHVGIKRRAHNLTAKAGLTGLTRALAVEFADRGITANMVSPGAIETVRPESAGAMPQRATTSPIPRPGHVDEVASAVRFLCEPQQAYMTGQILHVNGGIFLGT
jgi:3-oxoacyl-[acyl-carrier protein] reductase